MRNHRLSSRIDTSWNRLREINREKLGFTTECQTERQRYLKVVAVDGDDDGDDDGIRVQAVAVDKPLPRCKMRPRRPPPVADDDGGDAAVVVVVVVVVVAAAAAAVAVDAVVVAAAVAAVAAAAVLERCLRIPATRRRAPGRFRATGPPTTRAPPRTDCRCCAASGRNPRADSRARNCCARSCVRGASPVPASFQPVAPPALVAVPVVHVLLLLLPSVRSSWPTTDGTRCSFILVDDDHDEDEDKDDSGDETHERDNEEEAGLSHMSRRHRRRERHRRVRSVSIHATDDQRSETTRDNWPQEIVARETSTKSLVVDRSVPRVGFDEYDTRGSVWTGQRTASSRIVCVSTPRNNE